MARSVHHPVFARVYAWLSHVMEEGGGAELRERLLAGLRGRVLEVGAGNGLNFRHYPDTVTEVVAVEPEDHLRHLAEREVAQAAVPIELLDGVVEDLPHEDGSFDAAVVSLMLCSVADQARALAEVRRVLRPGGELRFFEHVRATTPGLARAQRVVDATVWPWVGGGCHTSRDTAAAIADAGFTIESIDRFRFPEGPLPSPTAPHVLGVARRA